MVVSCLYDFMAKRKPKIFLKYVSRFAPQLGSHNWIIHIKLHLQQEYQYLPLTTNTAAIYYTLLYTEERTKNGFGEDEKDLNYCSIFSIVSLQSSAENVVCIRWMVCFAEVIE